MTTVTRKEYDTQGTETVLGLPCKTVTQNWDGAVTSTKMSILDAFNINDIQVDETNRSSSSQSQSLMSLASNIASVKLEERLIPTSFTTPKVMGFPIKSDGSADISAELVEDTLTEVTLTNPITVKGIPVYKIWKGSDNVSFVQIESSAIMDGRATMQGYKTEGASECVYSALSASDASAIGSLVSKTISNGNVTIDGVLNEESITSNKYIAIAFNAKKAMDSICGIGLVGVGVNGGCGSVDDVCDATRNT